MQSSDAPRGGIAIACMLFGQLYVNSPFVGHLYVSFFFVVATLMGLGSCELILFTAASANRCATF